MANEKAALRVGCNAGEAQMVAAQCQGDLAEHVSAFNL